MRATLSNYRQAPRKVRLIADLIRGETVERAYTILEQTPKRATDQVRKLLASAVANAQQSGRALERELVVREVRVDEGVTLKRFRPVSRGSAHPIRKRTSTVTIVLGRTTVKNQESRIKNKKKSVRADQNS